MLSHLSCRSRLLNSEVVARSLIPAASRVGRKPSIGLSACGRQTLVLPSNINIDSHESENWADKIRPLCLRP